MKSLLAFLVLAAADPAWGQFALYLVNGNIEQPVGRAYDFGTVEPGGSLAVPFRIRNVTSAPATLDLLTVSGTGFSFASQTALPALLASQKSMDFTVVFEPAGAGNYSAALDSVAISVILTAEVPLELTAQLETATGVRPLGAAPVDFGPVELGSSATVHVLLVNQTNTTLLTPGALVSGGGFALSGSSAGGTVVQPVGSVTFDVQFTPVSDGAANGQLSIGDRSYLLIGTGIDPPLPQPRLALSLPKPQSAQQGSVTVNLDAPAQTSGSGTVTLAFVPASSISASATDAGIEFASGGLSAVFTVSKGDSQGHFGAQLMAPFQTGTTAGTLTITVQLGTNSDRQSIAILPAVVGVTAAQAVRSAGAVEVDLTGFDNTRTAGLLAFTFFDASGNAIATVNADGTSSFASYFQNAADGTFALQALFPVEGDSGRIAAFQAVMTNSAGASTSARTNF